MKQTNCPHGSTFAHSKLQDDGSHIVCPGPLNIKVEPTTTKEGDINTLRDNMETKRS